MLDTSKYLIHADVFANGVVERSDVVGAVYGQTEGLLGDEMDLHDLQQASKVGRIEVDVESEQGRSRGHITIASNLDTVETAILAAALETIDRVGPCRATITVDRIEDVRAATRREIVDRAHELVMEGFEDTIMTSDELVEAVRERVRVADVTEYEGFPAGPRVADSDAVILVEGRADVVTLLKSGIKNAVAVEGTDVPAAIASLTEDRATTAFLDGDRGGELILRELDQVASIDSVAFAPAGRSVEDLDHDEVMAALQRKEPVDAALARLDAQITSTGEGAAGGGESLPTAEADPDFDPDPGQDTDLESGPDATADRDPLAKTESEPAAEPTSDGEPARESGSTPTDDTDSDTTDTDTGTVTKAEAEAGADSDPDPDPDTAATPTPDVSRESSPDRDTSTSRTTPSTQAGDGDSTAENRPTDGEGPTTTGGPLREQVGAVIGDGTGSARFLDGSGDLVDTVAADAVLDALEAADPVPHTIIVDAPVDQRMIDVAADRGVSQVIGRERGEFTKQPTAVRVLTADELHGSAAEPPAGGSSTG